MHLCSWQLHLCKEYATALRGPPASSWEQEINKMKASEESKALSKCAMC